MCEALKQIERHAMKKGIKQGERRGERRGEKRGQRQGILMTLFSLVNDGLLQLEEAARRADLSEAAFRMEMKKAGYI